MGYGEHNSKAYTDEARKVLVYRAVAGARKNLFVCVR